MDCLVSRLCYLCKRDQESTLDIARPHKTTPDGHVSYFSTYSDMYESYRLLRRERHTDRQREGEREGERERERERERALAEFKLCVPVSS